MTSTKRGPPGGKGFQIPNLTMRRAPVMLPVTSIRGVTILRGPPHHSMMKTMEMTRSMLKT